ncbi:hypothetical protein, variant [Aphanomyces invadans]|uniref:Uncharacterized protein n=1 Tax=Aphanomyces invadans TaxID=157072 RepID=A0A024UT36_9STRA|nr:hypothetical protein, variant [Aphanomyces invadans]ETW09681.1 hypothetical protein, variant [Aphanomyces invadans]|eukprot:XP_008861092.1 hypothetical protein, variant [Aphanomyces invadans]
MPTMPSLSSDPNRLSRLLISLWHCPFNVTARRLRKYSTSLPTSKSCATFCRTWHRQTSPRSSTLATATTSDDTYRARATAFSTFCWTVRGSIDSMPVLNRPPTPTQKVCVPATKPKSTAGPLTTSTPISTLLRRDGKNGTMPVPLKPTFAFGAMPTAFCPHSNADRVNVPKDGTSISARRDTRCWLCSENEPRTVDVGLCTAMRWLRDTDKLEFWLIDEWSSNVLHGLRSESGLVGASAHGAAGSWDTSRRSLRKTCASMTMHFSTTCLQP